MSTRINTNVTALQAAANLNTNSNALATNIERLSSGLRINSAADDPAGLAISENFKAQISGLSTATSNSNDAINEVKTAEGALNQVQNLLISMRQLAVNASNLGTNSTVDLQADQSQINSAIQSINQIATTTSFGNKFLLNGAATDASTTTAGTTSGTGVSIAAQGVFNAAQAGNYNTLSVTAAQAATDAFAFTGGTLTSTAGQDGLYTGSLIINGAQYTLNTAAPSSLTSLNSAISASGYQASIDGSGELEFTNDTSGAIASAGTIDTTGLTVGGNLAIDPTSGNPVAGTGGTVNVAFGVPLSSTIADNTIGTAGSLTYSVNGGSNVSVSLSVGETLAALSTSLAASGVTLSVDSGGTSLDLAATGSISVSAFTGKVADAAPSTLGVPANGLTVSITPTGGALSGTLAGNTFTQSGVFTFTDGNGNSGNPSTIHTSAGESLATFEAAVQASNTDIASIAISGGKLVVAGDNTHTVTVSAATTLTIANSTPAAGTAAGVIGGAEGTAAGYTFSVASSPNATLSSAGALFSGVLTVSGGGGSQQILTLSPGSNLAALNAALTAATASVSASVDTAGDLVFTSVGSTTAPTVTLGSSFTAYQGLTRSGAAASSTSLGSNATLTISNASNTLVSSSTQSSGGTNYYNFANGLVVADTQTSGTITGNVTATQGTTATGQTLEYQIGADGGETTSLNIQSTTANLLGNNAANYVDANGTTQTVDTDSIADLNLMTFKGSQDAIAVIDQAINQVSTIRANLGSFQTNVLQSNVTSLGVAQQNLSSSLSSVEDTNLSTEIVQYTKNQILVQAATSALSQANQAPQAILKLLQ
jgi:flagellin